MAHIHDVIDTDVHYKIDGVTRTITNIDETKRMLVQHDHNSERLTFEVPRYVDGHDFSKCNIVQIHYENTDTYGKNESADVYEVDDLHVSEVDDDVVVLSWLVHGNATKYVGSLSFTIRFSCVEVEGIVDYAWNTTTFEGITIQPGIYNSNRVEEQYSDILEKWKEELETGGITDEQLLLAIADYIAKNPVVKVDSQLSETSENPVQNKVVTETFNILIEEFGNVLDEIRKDCVSNSTFNATAEQIIKNYATKQYVQDEISKIDIPEGSSITITNITQSTEDGGSNIVTFSDGSTLTVKNGKTGAQGIQGKQGERGADGYTPVKGTDYFTKADKEEMVEDVVASLGGIPDYWVSALETGVNEIRQAMETAGRNKSSFLFYSDAHWDHGSQMSPTLLKYLHKNTAMTKTFFGGDIVNTESANNEAMKYLYEWREMIKDLPNHHSVVGNHDDGNGNKDNPPHNSVFDENYVYAFLLAPEETPNMVMGEGLYYYIDEPCEKTRYLFLDTAYKDQFTLSTAQSTFITEALKSTPENWHIVVVSHRWYDPSYTDYYLEPTITSVASSVLSILDNYNSRRGDFADCGGKVEFCIGGHAHFDYDNKTSGGIPIILVETDSGYARRTTFELNSTNESSVNGIIADYDNQVITIVRVGRGSGKTINLETGETHTHSYTSEITTAATCTTAGVRTYTCSCGSTYTETIPVISHNYVDGVCSVCGAEDGNSTPTYTNVLDTVGYTKGVYLSNGQESKDDNAYTTGYIRVNEDGDRDTVYLANITLPNEKSHGNRIASYDINQQYLDGTTYNIMEEHSLSPVFDDENGNLIQFNTPDHNGIAYIRISAWDINENSIITVNQEIK